MGSSKADSVAGRKSDGFIGVEEQELCHRAVLRDTRRPGNQCK